jgi:DNA-binding NtrC family response regulator
MNSLILVVDDERAIADSLAAIMKAAGYESLAVYSAGEAVAVLATKAPALIITDVIMPGMNGIELAVEARTLRPQTRVLLVSGNAITQTLTEAARLEGYDFEVMAKPVPPREMLAKVSDMLNEPRENGIA